MRLTTKDGFDLYFELNVAIENVKRRLAKHDSMLNAILADAHTVTRHAKGVGTPLRIELLPHLV